MLLEELLNQLNERRLVASDLQKLCKYWLLWEDSSIDFVNPVKAQERLKNIITKLDPARDAFRTGRIITSGIFTADIEDNKLIMLVDDNMNLGHQASVGGTSGTGSLSNYSGTFVITPTWKGGLAILIRRESSTKPVDFDNLATGLFGSPIALSKFEKFKEMCKVIKNS